MQINSVAVLGEAIKPKNPAWCSRADWTQAYPQLENWHWLAGALPPSLSPSQFSPTQTVVVEHPWQARWLQNQWALMANPAAAQPLPRVVTLNSWLNEALTVQFPQALNEQTAAITVWRAVQSLNKKRSPQDAKAAPTPGRWALAQQMVALLAEIETLQGVQPAMLDRLEGSHSAWLSREAQWLKAVRASLQDGEPTTWSRREGVMRDLARTGVAAVLPAAHPSSIMQAFLALLGGDVAVGVPDVGTMVGIKAPQLVQCADFESEAQAGVAWVKAQIAAKSINPLAAPKLAIVAHNRALARRIGALLARDGFTVDDRVGWALSTTIAASSVKGLLDAVVDEDPAALMQWLSLPAVQAAFPAAASCGFYLAQLWHRQAIIPDGAAFVRLALRQLSEKFGSPAPDHSPQVLLQNLLAWQMAWGQPATVAQHSQALLAALAPLTTAMQDDAAGCLVWRCMEALTLEPSLERVPFSLFARLLQTRLETERYAPAVPNATVQFLPLHEAGWTDLDALLMVGCNELHFPSTPQVLAPLLASVRRELGVPAPQAERASWLHVLHSGADITASFAVQEQGNPTRLSPWLLGYPVHNFQTSTNLVSPAQPDRSVELTMSEAPALQGMVLPSRLSVTAFAKLGQCPYQFMLASVLGVRAAAQPEPWPTHREKGNVLHTALHAAVQDPKQDIEAQLQATLAQMAEQLAPLSGRYAALIDDAKRLLPVFLSEHQARKDAGWRIHSTETSYAAEGFFDGLELHGKTDRLDTRNNDGETQYALIDYKTSGETALKAMVKDPLSDAQLVLYAALLDAKELGVAEALYWRLHDKSDKSSFVLPNLEQHKGQAIGLFGQAWEDLQAGEPALALPSARACKHCDYAGVCRAAASVDDEDSELFGAGARDE